MSDLAELILGEQRERFASPPPAVAGVVAESSGADLYVVIPDYDPQIRFGPCPFVGSKPTRGDVCLVVFDDERQPWVILPGVPGSGIEVDATASATTLAPGSAATVVVTEPASNLFHFAFGIPRGDVGAQGPPGTPGAQGAKGDTGAQGPVGGQGPVGTQGPVGPQGVKGDTGAQGPQGVKGDTGAQGTQGNTGAPGPAGPIGTVQDEGIPLTQVGTLNFVGPLVTATYDPPVGQPLGRANITVALPAPTVLAYPYDRTHGNTWDNVSGYVSQLRKLSNGLVVGEGLVRCSPGYSYNASTAIMGFIPAGWRPVGDTYLTVMQVDSAGNRTMLEIWFRVSDGLQQIVGGVGASNNGIANAIHLGDMSWYAAQ